MLLRPCSVAFDSVPVWKCLFGSDMTEQVYPDWGEVYRQWSHDEAQLGSFLQRGTERTLGTRLLQPGAPASTDYFGRVWCPNLCQARILSKFRQGTINLCETEASTVLEKQNFPTCHKTSAIFFAAHFKLSTSLCATQINCFKMASQWYMARKPS